VVLRLVILSLNGIAPALFRIFRALAGEAKKACLNNGYGEVTRRLRVTDFAPEPGGVFVGAAEVAGRSTPFPIKSDCS